MNEIPLAYPQVGGLNFMTDARGELLWCTLHLDACLLLVEHFQSLSMPLWALSRAAFFTGAFSSVCPCLELSSFLVIAKILGA